MRKGRKRLAELKIASKEFIAEMVEGCTRGKRKHREKEGSTLNKRSDYQGQKIEIK